MSDSIKVDLKYGLWTSPTYQIRVRAERDHVLMGLQGKIIKFRTPAAHKTGFALVKKGPPSQNPS